MPWLWIPIAAAVLYALGNFVDNYLVDHYSKRLNPKASQGLFIFTELAIAIGLLIFLRGDIFSAGNTWILILAGAADVIGTIFYWFSLRRSDTTDVTLLMQLSPIISLCFATIFLGQSISLPEFAGFLLILLASVVVVSAAGAKKLKFNLKTAGNILLACTIWVISDVIFISGATPTAEGAGLASTLPSFFWLLVGTILCNLVLFACIKSWRRDFRKYLKRGKLGQKIFWTALDDLGTTCAEIIWRFGVLVAPLALLSVVEGVAELITAFVCGIILTIIVPKFGREKLTRKSVAHHAVATALMIAAIIIIG